MGMGIGASVNTCWAPQFGLNMRSKFLASVTHVGGKRAVGAILTRAVPALQHPLAPPVQTSEVRFPTEHYNPALHISLYNSLEGPLYTPNSLGNLDPHTLDPRATIRPSAPYAPERNNPSLEVLRFRV